MDIEMHLNQKYFNLIENGIKDIEVRLLDEKRSQLKHGDTITFINNTNIIKTIITNISLFDSFEKLLYTIPYYRIGLSNNEINLQLNELFAIYPMDKVEKYKIMAIEIKKEY